MRILIVITLIFCTTLVHGQDEKVNWLDFEQLEEALKKQPKKVMVYFYADWCAYCKKMDRSVFTKQDVIALLNDNYYTIKFNVESNDTIQFGGKTFTNKQFGKKRNPIHQIPEYLASRQNAEIELPATIILNEDFEIKKRFYRYISPTEMLSILKQN
ncbi:thioredoxin family protein [Winogradskyella alexanderae]|uniref:Thioredoxin family protein n=1 Tax=Winogradskyella alexanderae TaxID=2877123 RepID=A0ABS7XN15_9FLAO|nr:thioredoxin family protein [Winogradskyella alexanderae]MCA0131389.1 thioredoxin family protein [Winogradskyella alexanderae]